MRYVLLACLIALCLALDLGLLLATTEDAEQTVALHGSATPLPDRDISLRTIRLAAREFAMDLFDGLMTPCRELLRRRLQPEPLP